MKNIKNIDIFYLGKNSFNSCFSQLKNDKKVLRLYSQHIEGYLNSIEENKNLLKNINRDIDKNISSDKPFCFLKKFELLLNLQSNYYDYFLENSQKSFENLKESVDKNLEIITNFLSNIQTSSTNIKNKSIEFFEKHEKVIQTLDITEKSIIEDYFKSKYNLSFNKDKDNTTINSIEEIVNESYKKEKEFYNSTQEMKDIFCKFLTEYNSNMKEIKKIMTKLNEDSNKEIINIIQIMKDNCNNLINIMNDASQKIVNFDKNNNDFINNYSEYLNNEIKKDELFQVLENDKYKIKIINEEERNKLEKEIYINSNLKNRKNSKRKSIPNFKITGKDIYNIVEKIYSFNFSTINKEEFNLVIEKQKLEITELTGKLLGYNFDINEVIKKEKNNIENMSEEDINNFIDFIFKKEDYIIEFLTRLNNYRASGKLELSLDIFNVIKIIFDKAADYLLLNTNKRIYNFMIILSQTFYIMKDNKKYFLQKELKKKKYFRSINFWLNKLDNTINEELERFENELTKNDINFNEKKKLKKKGEILFNTIVSFVTCLNGFELEKEKVDQIVLPLFEKYNIKDEIKQIVLPMLDVYKNN